VPPGRRQCLQVHRALLHRAGSDEKLGGGVAQRVTRAPWLQQPLASECLLARPVIPLEWFLRVARRQTEDRSADFHNERESKRRGQALGTSESSQRRCRNSPIRIGENSRTGWLKALSFRKGVLIRPRLSGEVHRLSQARIVVLRAVHPRADRPHRHQVARSDDCIRSRRLVYKRAASHLPRPGSARLCLCGLGASPTWSSAFLQSAF
jgi:hypothetical protein